MWDLRFSQWLSSEIKRRAVHRKKTDVSENMSSPQRMPSSGMWCRVDLVRSDVSEKRAASIFMVEKCAREKPFRRSVC
jgi:hypothetical protein